MTSGKPDWAESDPQQAEALDAFCREMRDSWVWLYRQRGRIQSHSVGQYSALLIPDRVSASLSKPSWDVHIGMGGYGFTEYFEGEDRKTVYERSPGEGIELLVNYRDFFGIRPRELEIVEEFRVLFNLWEDRDTQTYYYFDESGHPVKAAVINEDGVRVLAGLLRRFQAAKQMYLALYIDSTLRSDELPKDEARWSLEDDEITLSYYRGELGLGGEAFSRLLGKRLISPLSVEASGISPYEKEEKYESFVIGTSEVGEEIQFTSDPDQLANYFGANPDSPHYLTPVYFRREVLNKYYADPDRFSVEDGFLRCGGLWGLRLDNDQAGHVMVFLGDLGRDIPQSEARYWRSFNIPPPEEGPSETLVRRAFGGQFANPKSPDLQFPHIYRETNDTWESAFGWPLFKALHADDHHVLGKLHIPVSDGAAEFDEQVLYLAKLLVDSLNEAGITKVIGKGEQGERGLAKLERFLGDSGMQDPGSVLRPFAEVQGLRSRGAAHRKGSSFDVTEAIGERGRRAGFEQLLTNAIETLKTLRGFAENELKVEA